MKRIIDLAQSRKAKSERSDTFRTAARDLLETLDHQRQHISEEFMTFLLAMAVSDQALHYAEGEHGKNGGLQFMDHLLATARQLFESHYQPDRTWFKKHNLQPCQQPAQVVELNKQPSSHRDGIHLPFE